VLIQAIRRHWTIENGLHWVLDVTFREDDSRVRDRIGARNLAVLRKIAINLINRDRTTRISIRAAQAGRLERRVYAVSFGRLISCVAPGINASRTVPGTAAPSAPSPPA
jgi:hypothetical protein